MENIKEAILKSIESARVGEEVIIKFSGIPALIHIEFLFSGGWVIKQSIPPGGSLNLKRGTDGFLQEINIIFNTYDGLKICK